MRVCNGMREGRRVQNDKRGTVEKTLEHTLSHVKLSSRSEGRQFEIFTCSSSS